MSDGLARQIADAVLHEGYLLYPYRPSALKNRVRWLFGRVFPKALRGPAGSETSALGTECLVLGDDATRLLVRLRFFHVIACRAERADGPPLTAGVPMHAACVSRAHPTQEAVAREAACEAQLAKLAARPTEVPFAFPGSHAREPLSGDDGRETGALVREQRAIAGVLEVSAVPLGDGAYRVSVEVRNVSPIDAEEGDEERALGAAFVSTHLLLNLEGGEFVSLRAPPAHLAAAALGCRLRGLWPVLVGREGSRDAVLAAPIILDEYPRIAPESAGDLFDGTEIDELLTLRIRTLSEHEKQEIRLAGGPAAAVLDRSERMDEEGLRRLHGAVRFRGERGRTFQPGDRVRIRPSARADAFDQFLAGRTAVVCALERDFDGRDHVAVTLDDDPGRDLGEMGMPGHRFFFRVAELEPLQDENPKAEARNPECGPCE